MLLTSAISAEDVFKTEYICYDLKGEKRWKAVTEIKEWDKKSSTYLITEQGYGQYTGFTDNVSWKATCIFKSTDDVLQPYRFEKKLYDSNGELIQKETKVYDYKKNKVFFTKANYRYNFSAKREYNFQEGIIDRLLLGLYVQRMLEKGEKRGTVEIVSGEPQFYKANIDIIKEEDVSINGKTEKAYKLCINPNLGLLNIVKVFIPKSYVWHQKAAPHKWLKYKGLESNISSPKVEIITADQL